MGKDDKQEVLVQNILDNIGGISNIKDVYHCATRMRFTLYDEDLVKVPQLKVVTNIKGALWSNGELQVIIGPQVGQVTTLLKSYLNLGGVEKHDQSPILTLNGTTISKQTNASIGRRFLKSVSAVFGPLIPFLIGVGLIMALQQLLIRTHLGHDVEGVLGTDYNLFDYVLNVIAQTGFKLMGVVAIWSVVRYLGGHLPTAIALSLVMVSPIIPENGIALFSIGDWDITLKPFYSTILVFLAMGILIAYGQKLMDKYFNPVANFILNPLLTILLGGLLAFFVMGPIMGVIENVLLTAFNWFMNLPIGIGALIVGLTWQPLVVLGVHNILFFAATTDLTTTGRASIFLAAAFAAAWAQMGATIGVGLKSKKTVDKFAAFAAALPGVISGPTESCIYGVNLPKGKPFILGTLAGAVGGWMIGIFGVDLDNLAGLGGIVGFLAYSDDLVAAILIDLASLVLGVGMVLLLWSEVASEKSLALKTTKTLNKLEFLNSKIDFAAKELIKILKTINSKKSLANKAEITKQLTLGTSEINSLNTNLNKVITDIIFKFENNSIDKIEVSQVISRLKQVKSTRQAELNQIYVDLKKDVVGLKKITPSTKTLWKLLVRKANIDYSRNKLASLKEEKNAKLFTQGEKLISTNNSQKMQKGKEMIILSQNNNWQTDRIISLNEKFIQIESEIKINAADLNKIANKYYHPLEERLDKIAIIKNKNLSDFKNKYYNDIHHVEILERLIIPKNVIS